MRNFLHLILTTFILIIFNACGGENNKTSTENFTSEDMDYTITHMQVNKKYEVNPNDIYIPKKENTKLKIEYQPLSDKKFITILNGEAILKKEKN